VQQFQKHLLQDLDADAEVIMRRAERDCQRAGESLLKQPD